MCLEETYGSPIWTPIVGDRAVHRVIDQDAPFQVSSDQAQRGQKASRTASA